MGTVLEQSRVAREIGDGHGTTGSGYTPKFFTANAANGITLTLGAYERTLYATTTNGFGLTVTLPAPERVPGAIFYIRGLLIDAGDNVVVNGGGVTLSTLTHATLDWTCVMSVGPLYIVLAEVVGGTYA